jgi:hypothetical protein
MLHWLTGNRRESEARDLEWSAAIGNQQFSTVEAAVEAASSGNGKTAANTVPFDGSGGKSEAPPRQAYAFNCWLGGSKYGGDQCRLCRSRYGYAADAWQRELEAK